MPSPAPARSNEMEKDMTTPVARIKFVCTEVGHTVVRFAPVYTGSKENERFFEATPAGSIELQVVKRDTIRKFEVGREYHIDFTPDGVHTGIGPDGKRL